MHEDPFELPAAGGKPLNYHLQLCIDRWLGSGPQIFAQQERGQNTRFIGQSQNYQRGIGLRCNIVDWGQAST